MNLPKLALLGTGGDCEIIGKARTGAGILFQMPGTQLHIDPGPGALIRLGDYGFNAREHTAILASSPDLAHTHDLPALISAMTLNGLDVKGTLIATRAVLKERLPEAFQRMCKQVLQAEPGKKFLIENVEITCLKTTSQSSVGFRVLTPEFSFAYSSDTSYDKNIVNDYKADVLVLNTPSREHTDQLCMADAAKIITKAKPKLAVLTHFGLNFHNQNPIYAARELTKQTGVKVIAAEDGMILDTLDYSIKPVQKILKRFMQPTK